jgi:hypothetical protein
LRGLILVAAALAAGCAHGTAPPIVEPAVELQLDEGRAAERPLIPGRAFELLLRFEPKLPAYTLARLRFRLAQPGPIAIAVYRDEHGAAGAPVKAIERRYGPELVAAAGEGKWVVEDLAGIGPLDGAVWVGLSSPEREGDPRLWATSNDSGAVFSRETEPGRLGRVPRTPVLRLEIRPAQ